MKRAPVTPDLFAGQPTQTSSPKFIPALPTTPTELHQLQVKLWEDAPRHIKGVVGGHFCIYTDACWQPIAKLTPAELVAAFSLQ